MRLTHIRQRCTQTSRITFLYGPGSRSSWVPCIRRHIPRCSIRTSRCHSNVRRTAPGNWFGSLTTTAELQLCINDYRVFIRSRPNKNRNVQYGKTATITKMATSDYSTGSQKPHRCCLLRIRLRISTDGKFEPTQILLHQSSKKWPFQWGDPSQRAPALGSISIGSVVFAGPKPNKFSDL